MTKTTLISNKGLISRGKVSAKISKNPNKGLRFITKEGVVIVATVDNVSSTQRNTVLSKDDQYICLVEHFLGACALTGVNNIDVLLDTEELPFGDGSASFWIEALSDFQNNDFKTINLNQEIKVVDSNDSEKFITLTPSEKFSITYNLIMPQSVIGAQSYTWDLSKDINEVTRARTFSSKQENQMLGLDDWVLGYDESGFDQKLHFNDEPARHKVLDLIGDLYLSGINPLHLKAKIISNKGGHNLNVEMARKIKKELNA